MDLHLDRMTPEIVVVATALLAVTADLLAPPGRARTWVPFVATAGLLAALAALLFATPDGGAVFGHFVTDGFSRFARALALGGGVLVTLLAWGYTSRLDRGHGEFFGLLVLALLGVMLVSGVADLMSMFVSLELVTISSYALAAFKRNDPKSTEAGLKYLIIGAVSTAVLLFGIALVYGATGSVDFSTLSSHVAAHGASPLLLLGTALVVTGLFFKAAAVPFQVWAPDVYQGAPTPVTAFLSSLSKSAGFVLLLRVLQVLVVPAAEGGAGWASFFAFVAGATLLYGNLGAVAQKDVKRLLAYSSIGHAGFLMMGVAAVAAAHTPTEARDGAQGVLFYLLAYYLTTATAFAAVAVVSAGGRGHRAPVAYAGLAKRSPFAALAMLFALLSLAGVPPMVGLVGKFLLFAAVVQRGMYPLALVGGACVVVSLYYYLLLIREMYAAPPPDDAPALPAPTRPLRAVLAIGVLAVVVFGIWWGPVHDAARAAAAALFPSTPSASAP